MRRAASHRVPPCTLPVRLIVAHGRLSLSLNHSSRLRVSRAADLRYAPDYLPASIPSAQARLLGVGLVSGSALQWYWGVTIMKMAAAVVGGKPKSA